jgi:glycosyltransferase involved in cell wall biosynthesis
VAAIIRFDAKKPDRKAPDPVPADTDLRHIVRTDLHAWETKRLQRPLKILLSVYACEPDRGSEPGIGWQWATRLAQRGHEVYALTRANNREAIERALERQPIPGLHFVYFDLPVWARFWKRGGRGVQLYYSLWQWLCLPTARRLHAQVDFDVVHHLTFGVFRQASPLAWLGAPFVFGPVGGGEGTSAALRRDLQPAARRRERLRSLANAYARFDPLLRLMLKRTTTVLCKTAETREYLPKNSGVVSTLFLEIGSDPAPVPNLANARHGALRALYVGRLEYFNGLHLALPALAAARVEFPELTLTLVGSGPEEKQLRRQAESLGVAQAVHFVPWLPRAEVMAVYRQHDVFLFPSLHDSSGNAVLEAMSCGLPVVCLKRGGPAAIVDAFSGIAAPADDSATAVRRLGDALILLARNPQLRTYLARGAHARATNYFSWHQQLERMNALYYSLQCQAELRSVL